MVNNAWATDFTRQFSLMLIWGWVFNFCFVQFSLDVVLNTALGCIKRQSGMLDICYQDSQIMCRLPCKLNSLSKNDNNNKTVITVWFLFCNIHFFKGFVDWYRESPLYILYEYLSIHVLFCSCHNAREYFSVCHPPSYFPFIRPIITVYFFFLLWHKLKTKAITKA